MEQKKIFEEPTIEVIRFDSQDVLAYNSYPTETTGGDNIYEN